MKIEYKLQNDVLKNQRMNYIKLKNYIMLSDGRIGCYFKPDEIKIDLSKITEVPIAGARTADPDVMMETYQKASKTRYAVITERSGLLIRIDGEIDNRKMYIQEKQLKMFYGYTGIMIPIDDRGPVLILKYGIPYGIVLPVIVGDDEK